MRTNEGTSTEALMEQLIETGPEDMAAVFAGFFNLAMRIERERFLGADRETEDRQVLDHAPA